jgi:hypothetical protein
VRDNTSSSLIKAIDYVRTFIRCRRVVHDGLSGPHKLPPEELAFDVLELRSDFDPATSVQGRGDDVNTIVHRYQY